MLCTAEYFANELNRLRPLREDEVERLLGCKVGKRRLWTARDDRQLERMARQGMTAHMIALKMGRTAWAVRSRVRNLKRRMQRDV